MNPRPIYEDRNCDTPAEVTMVVPVGECRRVQLELCFKCRSKFDGAIGEKR